MMADDVASVNVEAKKKHRHVRHTKKKVEDVGGPVLEAEETAYLLEQDKTYAAAQKRRKKAIVWVLVAVFFVVAAALVTVLLLPATYTCAPGVEGSYYVVKLSEPNITAVDPPIVCAGSPVELVLRGYHFVVKEGVAPTLYVTTPYGDRNITNGRGTECLKTSVRSRDVQTCRGIAFTETFEINEDNEIYETSVRLVNPEGYDAVFGIDAQTSYPCQAITKMAQVIPSPIIYDSNHPFICHKKTNNFVFDGMYLLTSKESSLMTNNTPSLLLCGEDATKSTPVMEDCSDMDPAAGYDFIRKCSRVSFSALESACTPGSMGAVTFMNPRPAVCGNAASSLMTVPVVDAPVVSSISHTAACLATGEMALTVTGSNFIRIDSATAKLSVAGTPVESDIQYDDCTDYDINYYTVSVCKSMTATMTYDAEITEPTPVDFTIASPIGDCDTVTTDAFVLLPKPTIESFTPATLCASTLPVELTATGSFYFPEGESLTASLDNTPCENVVASDCTTVEVGGKKFSKCTTVKFTTPATDLPIGQLEVKISNGCNGVASTFISSNPVPVITSSTQHSVCAGSDTPYELTGENFIVENGVAPTVVIGDYTVSSVSASECTKHDGENFQTCKKLSFTVPANAIPTGDATLLVKNNKECLCTSAEFASPSVVAPTVTDFGKNVCQNQDTTFYVVGTGFVPVSVMARLTSVDDSSKFYDGVVSEATETQFAVTFAADTMAAGNYKLTVGNADVQGCSVYPEDVVIVNVNEVGLWSVDPSILLKGASETTLTVLTSKFNDIPDFLSFLSADGAHNVTFTSKAISDASTDSTRFKVVFSGEQGNALTANEFLSVTARAKSMCTISKENLVQVIDMGALNSNFELASASPVSVPADANTVITIVAKTDVFSAEYIPNVYLIDVSAGKNYNLANVDVLSGTTIRATVTAGLAPAAVSKYRILVVFIGADGAVHTSALDNAVFVAGVPAPQISVVSPVSINATGRELLTITGANFQTSATYNVKLACHVADVTDITIQKVTATEILAQIGSDASDGQFCSLVLTDTTNGYVEEYGGISIHSATRVPRSFSLSEAPALCGHSSVVADIGSRAFLYVIGGDTDSGCTAQSAITNVSFGELNSRGGVDKWYDTTFLPSSRAFTDAVVVGKYIYVFGGANSAGVLDSVIRAPILQPDEAPIASAGIIVGTGSKLTKGTYFYAVSALFSATDKANPSGESLPSGVVSVVMPDMGEEGTVRISWDSVPGATSYRVYRTKEANNPASALVKLAECSTTEFVDNGQNTPDESVTPLAVGSLGKWYTLQYAMTSPRAAPAVSTFYGTSNTYYAFVFGGAIDSVMGNMATTYEHMSIAFSTGTEAHSREMHIETDWRSQSLTTSRFTKAVTLTPDNFAPYAAETEIASIILTNGADNNVYMSNFVKSSESVRYDPFPEAQVSSNFGACTMVVDDVLYLVSGTDDATTFAPNKYIRGMVLDTAVPTIDNSTTPVTSYTIETQEFLTGVVFAGCAQHRGIGYVVGGKTSSGNHDKVQYFPL